KLGGGFVVNADLWLEDEVTERNLVVISSISSTKLPNKLPSSRSEETSSPLESRSTGPIHVTERDSLMHPFAGQNRYMTSHSSVISSKPSSFRHSRSFPSDDKAEDSKSSQSEAINNPSNDTLTVSSERHEENQTSQFHISRDQQSETNPDAPLNLPVSVGGKKEESGETARGAETDVEDPIDLDSLTTPNLVGQTSVGGQVAPDLDERTLCIWFAFSTLSIRTEGVFKLRFSLIDLTQFKGDCETASVIHCMFSDPIQVQSPKKFLGTCDNNEIANHLNKYSIRIPSRKDEKPTRS
ncbi:hypothetical protein BGX21_001444, partial [Mortierella sp. AD011]